MVYYQTKVSPCMLLCISSYRVVEAHKAFARQILLARTPQIQERLRTFWASAHPLGMVWTNDWCWSHPKQQKRTIISPENWSQLSRSCLANHAWNQACNWQANGNREKPEDSMAKLHLKTVTKNTILEEGTEAVREVFQDCKLTQESDSSSRILAKIAPNINSESHTWASSKLESDTSSHYLSQMSKVDTAVELALDKLSK